MLRYRSIWMLLAATGLALQGCGGSSSTEGNQSGSAQADADHDHDDHDHGDGHDHREPKSVAEAVDVLEGMRDELAEGFKAADVKVVDEVIHEMGPMIKKARALVASAGMDRYVQADAEKALDQMVDVLSELHPSHDKDAKVDPADYDAQKDSLNDALGNLEKAAGGGGQ